MGAKIFTSIGGRLTIDKDPGAVRRYGVDLVDQGPPGTITVASNSEAQALGLDPLSVTAAGVTILDGPVVSGTHVTVRAKGGDNISGPGANWLRFVVPLTNGDQFVQVLYFNIVPG